MPDISEMLTEKQVCEIARISIDELRSCERMGLIEPLGVVDGENYYPLGAPHMVSLIKTFKDAGVTEDELNTFASIRARGALGEMRDFLGGLQKKFEDGAERERAFAQQVDEQNIYIKSALEAGHDEAETYLNALTALARIAPEETKAALENLMLEQ